LSVKQLSAETGMPVSTIYKLVEAELIPFIRLKDQRQKVRVYFRPAKIDAWLDSLGHAPCGMPDLRL
jgi:predicted DNA-binding transcriptional regulator AlpA